MQSDNCKIFIKAIYAGIFIGLGAWVYMLNPGIIGAFLFAIGLLGCVNNKLYLFTGRVGWSDLNSWQTKLLYAKILLGNAIGIIGLTVLLGTGAAYHMDTMITTATNIVNTRMSSHVGWLFFGSVGCGMLMSHAVDRPNRTTDSFNNIINYIPLLYCVPVFILSGFPHCVADMAYYTIYSLFNGFDAWVLAAWLICVIGNIMGCQIMGRIVHKYL